MNHVTRMLWIVLCGWVLLLAGCISPPTIQLPTYMVQGERLAEGPPAPVAIAPGDQASGVIPDQVRIEPASAVGYENLPESVTQLYSGPTQNLSLLDVINETLSHNRAIRVQGYTLRIAEWEIPVTKGIYDLVLSSRLQYDRVEEQTSTTGLSFLPVTSVRQRTAEVALSQLLPTGAQVTLAYSVVRSAILTLDFDLTKFTAMTATDKTYQHRTRLEFMQPLLRGFGPGVTNAAIHIAQWEARGAAADFQTLVEQQLVAALQTYWELIGTIEVFKVQVISYAAASDLLRSNRAKFEVGVLPSTDVLQAEAEVEVRREQIIMARQAVQDLEDQLKRLLFLRDDSPLWEMQVTPTQSVAWREISADLDETIQVALATRPEIRRARSMIEQSAINRRVARNAMLPQLNLFGQVEANGLDRGFDGGFNNHADGRFIGYTAGLEFVYPLQNRTARYRWRQANAVVEQSEESLRDLNDRIVQEVRLALRSLLTARERIDVTLSQTRSQQANLEAQTKRYDVGASTAFEVLDFQTRLAQSQSQHFRAVIDYNKAAIELERARGTLLNTYGVMVGDADLAPEVDPVLFPVGLN